MFICSTSSYRSFKPVIFTGASEEEVLSAVFNCWYDELLTYQDMDPETSEQFNRFSQFAEETELNRYSLEQLLNQIGIGFSMVEV